MLAGGPFLWGKAVTKNVAPEKGVSVSSAGDLVNTIRICVIRTSRFQPIARRDLSCALENHAEQEVRCE